MKRCEEMERKLRYLQREAMRDDIAIDELSKFLFSLQYIFCVTVISLATISNRQGGLQSLRSRAA